MLPEITDFCRLILFRHPELSPEDDGRAIGSGPARIGRRGQQTVLGWLRILEKLPIDAVASADRPQCEDPAAAIAVTKGLEVETDERLRDQSLGVWEGRSWVEIAQAQPDRVRDFFGEFGEVSAPEGESLGQAVERMLDWWADRRGDLLGKTVVVVAAGGLVTGFTAAMLGMRLSRAVSLQLPPGGCGIVDVYDNGVRISAWNVDALADS